ncbi:MAG: MFS transporter [Fimbriimonadales bacterium]|nr:MFS transporter [Fimbriimonadales bacterium]
MREAAKPWWRELSGYQWTVLLVAWLGWVFDVFDTSLFFLAKQPIVLEFFGPEAYAPGGRGPVVEGVILGCFYAGWALGGLVFGILADRWGRARTMVLTILLYSLFTGLTYFVQTWEQMAAIRFLTALGIGGEWAAGTALVAEALPNRTRAMAAGFLQSAAALGPVLAALANLALKDQSWRWLFVVGVAPALLTIWIRWKVREPGRWQAERVREGGDPLATLRGLFGSQPWARHAWIALTLAVVGILGASNISYWLPNLVSEASPGLPQEAIRARQSYAQMILHVGTIVGVFAFPALCERFGRKRCFAVAFALTPLAVAAATFSKPDYSGLLIVVPLMALLAIGLTSGFPLYFPELFPTRFRATGMGFAYNTGRVLQVPWPILTGWIIATVGGVGVGVGLTALVYLLGLAAVAMAPETKGRPLPD